MTEIIGLWSHVLAAALYAALALWAWRRPGERAPLTVGFAATALWASLVAWNGPGTLLANLAEYARNFAFLSFMYAIVRGAEADARQRALKSVYVIVAGVVGFQVAIAGVLPRFGDLPVLGPALYSTAWLLALTAAAGALVLVHNLYGQAAPGSRWSLRLPALALAGMWIYDLHLYTTSYLNAAPADDLFAMRGAAMAMLAPVFGLASRRGADGRLRLSRAATFQSLSLIAILAYLLLMMGASKALAIAGGEWARIAQIGFVSAMTLGALLLLPSSRARAWVSVMLAKHFFEHRYDYRAEWLAFTRTVGRAGEDAPPLDGRIVQAIADIAGSPAGLLLSVEDGTRLVPGAGWNWRGGTGSASAGEFELIRFLEGSAHVIDFDRLERGAITVADGRRIPVPDWMAAGGEAWAGVPLLHSDRLVGLVLIAQPPIRRPLDWEDFDLLRAAGIQAASYLAEARSQEALADAERFDAFNRRFAFIMHDIKNLVSQLSLVSRNAERHADNPAFRADMVATLQSSVQKMNALLGRLSHGSGLAAEPLRPASVDGIVAAVVDAKRRAHRVEIAGDAAAVALTDPARLEQALSHLVQNAIDASASDAPVVVRVEAAEAHVAIRVTDRGCGMSADFVRTRLFQPFASTKDGGFGVGAFEARALVAAMGGRLDVESRVGEGTTFTIFLPAAEADAAPAMRRRA